VSRAQGAGGQEGRLNIFCSFTTDKYTTDTFKTDSFSTDNFTPDKCTNSQWIFFTPDIFFAIVSHQVNIQRTFIKGFFTPDKGTTTIFVTTSFTPDDCKTDIFTPDKRTTEISPRIFLNQINVQWVFSQRMVYTG
jgi:hypothetical protein